MVESVYWMPAACAARQAWISPSAYCMPERPVGAIASGNASSSPSTVVLRLRCDMSTSTRWRSLIAFMSSTLASRVCSE